MKLLITDNKEMEVEFESNEEMVRFNQYFIREKRDSKFKKGDGKEKFYKNNYKIRQQFFEEVMKLCHEYGFSFNIDKPNHFEIEVSKEEVHEFCKQQIKDTIYEDLDMKDTFDSVYLAVKHRYMRMDLSVSYGKTIFIYLLSKFLILKKINKKILITVPKPQLALQMMGEFSEVNKNRFPFAIWRGGIKIKDAPVVMGNFEYLVKVKEEILSEFDVIIHDECHRTIAPSYKTIYEKCKNLVSTKGITGSLLEDRSAEDFRVIANTGATIKTVSKRDLINMGRATDGIIIFVILSYLPIENRLRLIDDRYNPLVNKLKSLEFERTEILSHEWRMKVLAKFSVNLGKKEGNGIIFFKSKEYGTKFLELLKKYTQDLKVFYIDEDIPLRQREEYFRYIDEGGNDAIILGTFDTIGTGISAKNIMWGMSIEPFKSFNLVEQVIGRFMRLHKNKERFKFYDVIDDGRVVINEGGKKIMKKNYFYSWMENKTINYEEHGFKIIKQYLDRENLEKKSKTNPLL